MTYDVNATGQEGDFCVTDGTEMKSVGAGIEFFPAKGTDDVRLHANAVYAWGKNGNVDGTMLPKQRWNLLSGLRRTLAHEKDSKADDFIRHLEDWW